MPVCLVHNCAGTEEGSDLHQRMKDQMRDRTRHSKRCHQRAAKQDIGKIADGRIGQPSFKMRFLQRPGTTVDDRHDRSA